MDRLVDVVKNMKEDLDPNDPRNLTLLSYQRRLRDTAARGRLFAPQPLPADLVLPVPGLADGTFAGASGRLQILRLRRASELLKHDPVPLRDADIQPYLYAALEDYRRSQDDESYRQEYLAKQEYMAYLDKHEHLAKRRRTTGI